MSNSNDANDNNTDSAKKYVPTLSSRLASWRERDGFTPRRGPTPVDLSDYAHLIGDLPDAEVARQAKCTPDTVRRYRIRHNLDRYERRVDLSRYDDVIVRLRGTQQRQAFADEHCVSPSTVYRRQRELRAKKNKKEET